LSHFARCVRGKEVPQITGEDGLVVMHALYAGYASAGAGQRITLPFQAPTVKRPIDLWLNGPAQQRSTRQ
jgi:myo-inositol 2-dehydrogenase/D-chiro-inositol 1-dehydrogenase